MKKFFKWLLMISGVLLIGVVILIYNPALLKGLVERQVSRLTGYSLALNGELEITTGPRLTVVATDIKLSNPDWAGDGHLLKISRLYLVMDRASLFEDVTIIDSLQIDGLGLSAETDANGVGNWVIKDAQPSSKPVETDDDGSKPPVLFNNIKLNDANLVYLNGKNDRKQHLSIALLDVHKEDSGMMKVTLDGSLNGRPVEYIGSIGPRDSLLTGRDVEFAGDGHFGSLKVNGTGLIDNLRAPSQPKFKIDLHGPDIDEITAMLDLDDLGAGPFDLSGSGEFVDGKYHADVHGTIGDISLNISARASDISQAHELDLTLAANGPSLDSLMRALRIGNWPDKPFTLKGDIKRLGARLDVSELTLTIGGTRLTLQAALRDFPHIDASEVDLSIVGDDVAQFRALLGVSGVATGPFSIHGKLAVSPDNVELIQVEGETSLGKVTLSGSLGAPPSYLGTKLHVHLVGDDARSVMSTIHIDALPKESFDLDAHAEWRKEGLQIEQGVLVTATNERLEFGGLIAIKPGGKGTSLDLKLGGNRLAQMLGGLVGSFEIPDQPYDLSGRLLLQEEGIGLQGVKAEFGGNTLTSSGLIKLGNKFIGTGFDFQIDGDNLSTLRVFPIIAGTVNTFVTGQPYQAKGRFSIEEKGWRLNQINGRIGKTDFLVNGLLSPSDNWLGSVVDFSLAGPAFGSLIKDIDTSDIPVGAFKSKGEVALVADKLHIRDLSFDADTAHGNIDAQLGWPLSKTKDVIFDIDIQGEDIRHFFPDTSGFKPARAAYKIKTSGHRSGDLISLPQFDASIGNLQITLQGKVNNDLKENGVDIAFNAVSNDISALGLLYGEPLPIEPLKLEAEFLGDASEFVIRNLKGSLGASQLEGSADVSFKGVRPNIKLTVNSSYLDMRPFLAPEEANAETIDNEPASTKPDEERIIPDLPTPLDELAMFDGELELKIDELRHRHDSLKRVEFEATLLDDHLKVSKIESHGRRGQIGLSFSIEPATDGKRGMEIDLTAREFIMNLSNVPLDEIDELPALDVLLNARVHGSTLRELAGSLNGKVLMGSSGGTLKDLDLSLLDATVLDTVVNVIIPPAANANPDQQLVCAATILEITDGMVKTAPSLAFTTDRMALVAKGTLDLKTEQIAFNFSAIPTNALKVSVTELFQPYTLVSGTLSNPVVGIDSQKAILHGGATIGTLGAYALVKGLADRAAQVVPPCQEMLKQVQQQQ